MEGCNLQTGNSPEEVCKAANEMNIKHLWLVGGGSLASSFIANNLLTNISLSLMPILLGSGIRLLGNLPSTIKIKKESEKAYKSGMLQLEYKIENA